MSATIVTVHTLSAADHLALQDLMLRYAAAVDERDRALYAACFTDDVQVHGFGAQSFHGRAAWVDYVCGALARYSASHHLLGPVRVLEASTTEATIRADVQATHFIEGASQPLVLYASYRSTLRRTADGWQICRHELQVRGRSG